MLLGLFGLLSLNNREKCQQREGGVPFTSILVQVLLYTFYVLIMTIAVILAGRCNPDQTFGFTLVAILFPEIYLIQYGIRKYVIKQEGYCEY